MSKSVAFSREDCLATVMQSPKAVAVHDKAAWLSIFARYNIVEDPVGSTPHVSGLYDCRSGRRDLAPLARFFDTFIAPMDIIFHVDRDVVCGVCVVRDLTIEIRMSPRVTIRVPMHLLYELVDEDAGGVLKIQRLAAHWELGPMLAQQMSFGLAGLVAGMSASVRMVRYLGFFGMLRFMKAIRSVGSTGKTLVERFVEGYNQQSRDILHATLSTRFEGVALPALMPWRSMDSLLQSPGRLVLGKTLASGNLVTASCTLERAGQVQHGVVFFEFDMHERAIHRVSFFIE